MGESVGVMASKSLNYFSDPPDWPCRPGCQADRRHVSMPRHRSHQFQSFYILCPIFSDNSKVTHTHTHQVYRLLLYCRDQIPERSSLRFVLAAITWLTASHGIVHHGREDRMAGGVPSVVVEASGLAVLLESIRKQQAQEKNQEEDHSPLLPPPDLHPHLRCLVLVASHLLQGPL